jgi:hypothetical protein
MEEIDTTQQHRVHRGEVFVRCMWCYAPLAFEAGYGWTHTGGGRYAMNCPECGWLGAPRPSPTFCPGCGSPKLRDSHIATPRRS